MSSTRSRGPSGLKWAAGATLVLVAFATLGFMFWASSREPSLEQIRRAVAARRWGDVEAGLRRWLQRHPQDGDAWEMLGGVLFDQGRLDEALTALRQVREVRSRMGERPVSHRGDRDPTTPARGGGSNAFGVRPRAIAKPSSLSSGLCPCSPWSEGQPRPVRCSGGCSRSRAIPATSPTASLISELESEVRDLSPELEEFLKQTPDDPWLRRVWGLFLLSRGRSAEALPHLEAAAMAFEEDPLGRFAWAECRMALGIAVDDLSLLGSPPSRAADAARWWVLRSRLAEALGRDEETLENLRKAVSVNPRNAEAHFRLGQAHDSSGRSRRRPGPPGSRRVPRSPARQLETRARDTCSASEPM